ncbi:MAG: response regulator [Desulfatibacillum sp.]|nr:response regulator [Desulfatibacillum sp.]
MDAFAKLISALSSLAWPAIFVLLLVKFQEPLSKLINSATGRKFTIKVAGNELTMEEASEQQRKIINDMQDKIVEMENRFKVGTKMAFMKDTLLTTKAAAISGLEPGKSWPGKREEYEVELPPPAREMLSGTERILWVDNNPRNNSYLMESLEERGVRVDIALTTDEGIKKFKSQAYDFVISDMGRPEGDKAGIELARKIRAMNKDIPFFIHCGRWAAANWRKQALEAGVTEITASGATLLSLLISDKQGVSSRKG